MTIFHSEPYKEVCRLDPMTLPLMEELEYPVISGGLSNDKPHQVYCESCKYRIEIQGIAGPKCGKCKRYLITIVKSALPDELVKSANLPTSGT